MNLEKLLEAKSEAERFLKKVEKLEERANTDTYAFWGCKESGDVRRSSMDLSRSLSELRKPN